VNGNRTVSHNTYLRIADYKITTDGSRTRLEILDANRQPILVYEAITLTFYQVALTPAWPTTTPTRTPTPPS
jgi:hypothetical protein